MQTRVPGLSFRTGEVYEFIDTIYGDNGNDYIFGGQDGDILAGGHGPDRGATDFGRYASDNDVIIGDNGELLFADDYWRYADERTTSDRLTN